MNAKSTPRQPMSRGERRFIIGVVLLVTFGLWLYSACTGTATADTLAADRNDVRTLTAEAIPTIAEALDAHLVEGEGTSDHYGEYRCSGAKAYFCDYSTRIRLQSTTSQTTEDFTQAFERAGFVIVQKPTADNVYSIAGTRDGIRIAAAIGGDDSLYGIRLTSPSREMAPNQGPRDDHGREPLDLG